MSGARSFARVAFSCVALALGGCTSSAAVCPPSDPSQANEAYAKIARRILERVAELRHEFPPLDAMDAEAPFRSSTVTADALDLAFELQHEVKWVRPPPTDPPTKQSMRPVLGPDGITMHLYFSSAPWKGQADVPDHKVSAMNVVIFVTIADRAANDRLYDAIVAIVRDEERRLTACR